jgi:hypothetical protein
VITPALDGVAFAASGDQILVDQGENNNPNFIYALNSEGSGWQSDATSSNTSALPEGLVEGESAIAASSTSTTDTLDHDSWWSSLKHGGLLISPTQLNQSFPTTTDPLPP